MGTRVHEKIPYIVLHVEDLERSRNFYSKFLGLETRDFVPDSKLGKNAVALHVQGTTIVLMARHGAASYFTAESLRSGTRAPAAGQCHPSFEVADLAAFHRDAKQRLEALHNEPEFGVKVECIQEPSTDNFGQMAVYSDPDGLLFSVVQKERQPATQGIVLSGGGAYGAFELGVLRHLANDSALGMAGSAHPAPAVLAGTSVGGFNAAVLACRMAAGGKFRAAVENLIAIWTKQIAGDLHNNGVFRLRGDVFHAADLAMEFRAGEVVSEAAADALFFARDMAGRLAYLAGAGVQTSLPRLLKMFDLSAMFSREPLRKLIQENISWDVLSQSPCHLSLAATDWTAGRALEFLYRPAGSPRKPHGDVEEINARNIRESVLASTAIPGVFRPVEVHTKTTPRPCVDGGLVLNTPLNPAIEAGASVIHLISLNPDVHSLALSPVNNTIDVFQRGLTTAVATNVASDLKRAKLINSIAGVARNGNGEFYREVTVHRYHPSPEHLGGVAGILDFTAGHLEVLMADGERAAREHNCREAGCVLAHSHRSLSVRA